MTGVIPPRRAPGRVKRPVVAPSRIEPILRQVAAARSWAALEAALAAVQVGFVAGWATAEDCEVVARACTVRSREVPEVAAAT